VPWTTPADVLAITGATVTDEVCALASSIIDTYAGTDYDLMPVDSISARDRRVLAKAAAWQAAWIPGQPGYLSHRGAAQSANVDGTSRTKRSQAEEDLAPLALRELKNLSWVGTRVVDLRPGRLAPKGAMVFWLSEEYDAYHPWSPV